MAYTQPGTNTNRVVETFAISDDRDRIRWGPIIGGIFVAIATQLILGALGAAIGLSIGGSGEGVGIGIGIWSIISLLIGLFIGSWVAAAGSVPMNRKSALLQGLILWATTLAISAWLLASGVSGAFGVAASNAGEVLNQVQQPGGPAVPNQVPNISNNQLKEVADVSTKAAWYFVIGSLLGLVASLIGASAGAKKPRTVRENRVSEHQTPPQNFV
jgi:ABC-type transport system involved in multi-copper enzyme maturation permease subunit